jgi:diguanylate cyclase (GGDEF)-like protein/PAS domain S-box-containing protein
MGSAVARAGVAAWFLVLSAVYYAFPGSHVISWTLIGASAAAAVVIGVRQHRPERPLAWYLIAVALVLFTTGDTWYNMQLAAGLPVPQPALPDVFYLLVYVFMSAGLLLFIRSASGDGNRAAMLDALVPTVGVGLIAWVYWIAPYARADDLTLLQKLVAMGYPLGDVLALAMMLRLLTVPGRRPRAALLLAAGVVGLLASDIIYGQGQLNENWTIGGPVDLGWIVYYAAFGLAALDPTMRRLTERTETFADQAGSRRLVFLALAALIAPVVLYLQYARDGAADALIVAAAAAVMFLLVLVRVADLLKAQRQAGERERTLREAGAVLMSAATTEDAVEALRTAVTTLMPPDRPWTLTIGDSPAQTGGPALRHDVPGVGVVELRAASGTLRPVTGPLETLCSQVTLVVERIGLSAEVSRRDGEAYFRTLIQSASDVILIVGDDDRITYASPSAETVFGYPDLAGTPLARLIADTHHEALREVLTRSRTGRGALTGVDLTAVCADRRLLQVECSARDLRDDPTVGALVLTVRDVTDRRRLENDLTHQAFHDGLTGLANRVLFRNRLEHAFALAGRDDTSLGVLFIDLDDFKEVNDTLGHAVGDQLLVAVAHRIDKAIGAASTAARMGGDEFAVLIENGRDESAAEDVAGRVVAALSAPVEVSDGLGGSHVVSGAASVGVATNADADSATELLRHADLALYLAKSAGKNAWQRYQSDLHTAMVERLEMRTALHEAVEDEQFVLQYQPIVDLASGDVTGVESLVRWQHPVRGLLGPNHFIELAEESGIIVPIGAWVLTESLRRFTEWKARAPESSLAYVSVNVSARQFRTPGFVDQVRRALADAGARPGWLLLEITESLVLRDVDQVWADLRELRALGVRIAIDDFGTGYSSLSYLRQMPVDVLKIDKSFIDDMIGSPQQRALVNAIVTLARNLDLAVVAEGIEDAPQRALLARMGCPYGQGYLFSRPAWPDDILGLLEAPLSRTA